MKPRRSLLTKTEKKSSRRRGKEIFLIRTWLQLKKRARNKLVLSRLLKTSLKSYKIKLQAIKQKSRNCITSSKILKKISISMVLKLLKPMLGTIVALNRSNSRTIWSQNSRRKTLKLKANSSNNRIFMKLLDRIEIFTQRISSKLKKKLQS